MNLEVAISLIVLILNNLILAMVRPKERSLDKAELLECWEAATPPFDLQAVATKDFGQIFGRIAGQAGAVSKHLMEAAWYENVSSSSDCVRNSCLLIASRYYQGPCLDFASTLDAGAPHEFVLGVDPWKQLVDDFHDKTCVEPQVHVN